MPENWFKLELKGAMDTKNSRRILWSTSELMLRTLKNVNAKASQLDKIGCER